MRKRIQMQKRREKRTASTSRDFPGISARHLPILERGRTIIPRRLLSKMLGVKSTILETIKKFRRTQNPFLFAAKELSRDFTKLNPGQVKEFYKWCLEEGIAKEIQFSPKQIQTPQEIVEQNLEFISKLLRQGKSFREISELLEHKREKTIPHQTLEMAWNSIQEKKIKT